MDGNDYTRGFVTGFIVAGMVGLLAQQLLLSRFRGIAAFFKPQTTVQRTSKSPFQVYLGCFTNLVFLIAVLVVGYLLVRAYRTDILAALRFNK